MEVRWTGVTDGVVFLTRSFIEIIVRLHVDYRFRFGEK